MSRRARSPTSRTPRPRPSEPRGILVPQARGAEAVGGARVPAAQQPARDAGAGAWAAMAGPTRSHHEPRAVPGGKRPRALIQMATGSGKTYTACSFCYRLIKFGKAKRILFLVDRNNLARQTLNEFQQFVSPQTNDSFTNEYVVQHLRGTPSTPLARSSSRRSSGCTQC